MSKNNQNFKNKKFANQKQQKPAVSTSPAASSKPSLKKSSQKGLLQINAAIPFHIALFALPDHLNELPPVGYLQMRRLIACPHFFSA